MLNKLRHLENAVLVARTDLNELQTKESNFKDALLVRLKANPNASQGYINQVVPISVINTRYQEGLSKGMQLVRMNPSQFSIELIWKPANLTDKQINKAISDTVNAEWEKQLTPLQEVLAFTERNLESFKDELRELNKAIAPSA